MQPRWPVSRRQFLAAGGAGLAGFAGCLSTQQSTNTPRPILHTDSDGEQLSSSEAVRTEQSGDGFPHVRDSCDVRTVSVEAEDGDDAELLVDENVRERVRCRGTAVDNMENLSTWEVLEGSLTADSTTKFGGTQSGLAESTTDQSRALFARHFPDGIDLSSWDFSIAIHRGSGDSTARNLRLQLLAPDYDNRIDMWHPIGDVDGWQRLDFGPTELFGDPDLTNVREMRLRNWSSSTPASFHIDELRATEKLDKGSVILTFDDNQITQYDTAYPILEEYGYPGVVGTIPWIADREERLDVPELTDLQNAGWDIVSHPQIDHQLRGIPVEEQRDAIIRSKRWLVDNGFEKGAQYIIWPYNAAGEDALDIASRYHKLGFCGGDTPSGLITDPMTISRVNGDDVDDAKNVLDKAAQFNQTAVLMYHTVGTNRISEADFRSTIAYIDSLGLDVVTPSTLWEEQFE